MTSAIINARLPLAEEYASLPGVGDIHDLFSRRAEVVNAVKELIIRHGVADQFVLLALHKHFDVPSDHVLLLQTVPLPGDGSLGEVVHPIPKDSDIMRTAQPVAFFVSGNNLQPYKYAVGGATLPDLGSFTPFLQEFINLLKRHNAEKDFSLKFPNVSPHIAMGEGEIPDYGATLLVPVRLLPEDTSPEGIQASKSFAPECAKGEKHAKNVRGLHTVFFKTGRTAELYHAAVAIIQSAAQYTSANITMAKPGPIIRQPLAVV